MSELKKKFEAAVVDSKNLPERPSNDVLLQLYALYKQATDGDVEGKRPGFTDMVGRAKYDAWAAHKDTAGDARHDALHRSGHFPEGLIVRRLNRRAVSGKAVALKSRRWRNGGVVWSCVEAPACPQPAVAA